MLYCHLVVLSCVHIYYIENLYQFSDIQRLSSLNFYIIRNYILNFVYSCRSSNILLFFTSFLINLSKLKSPFSHFLEKYNDFIEANRKEDPNERLKTLRNLVSVVLLYSFF